MVQHKVIRVARSPERSISGELGFIFSFLLRRADFLLFAALNRKLYLLACDDLRVAWIIFFSELFEKQVGLKKRFQVNSRRVFRRRSAEQHRNRWLRWIARRFS